MRQACSSLNFNKERPMKFDLRSRWVPPASVRTLDQVHLTQQPLYDWDGFSEHYRLHAGGLVLARLRQASVNAGFNLTVLPPAKNGKPPLIALDAWGKTIAAATANERRVLLVAASRGELNIGK